MPGTVPNVMVCVTLGPLNGPLNSPLKRVLMTYFCQSKKTVCSRSHLVSGRSFTSLTLVWPQSWSVYHVTFAFNLSSRIFLTLHKSVSGGEGCLVCLASVECAVERSEEVGVFQKRMLLVKDHLFTSNLSRIESISQVVVECQILVIDLPPWERTNEVSMRQL